MKWLFALLIPLLAYAEEPAPQPPAQAPTSIEEVKPEASPVAISSDVYQKQFFRTLVVILIIVGGAVVLILLTRRLSKNRPLLMNHKKNLKILERRQLSPNTYLYHMQMGNKQFVISESKLEVRLIANLDWDETNSDPEQ